MPKHHAVPSDFRRTSYEMHSSYKKIANDGTPAKYYVTYQYDSTLGFDAVTIRCRKLVALNVSGERVKRVLAFIKDALHASIIRQTDRYVLYETCAGMRSDTLHMLADTASQFIDHTRASDDTEFCLAAVNENNELCPITADSGSCTDIRELLNISITSINRECHIVHKETMTIMYSWQNDKWVINPAALDVNSYRTCTVHQKKS